MVNALLSGQLSKFFVQKEAATDVLSMTSVFFEISELKYFFCDCLTVFSQLF
jgi:hypothetical protein